VLLDDGIALCENTRARRRHPFGARRPTPDEISGLAGYCIMANGLYWLGAELAPERGRVCEMPVPADG
jgi:hypothetical protein